MMTKTYLKEGSFVEIAAAKKIITTQYRGMTQWLIMLFR